MIVLFFSVFRCSFFVCVCVFFSTTVHSLSMLNLSIWVWFLYMLATQNDCSILVPAWIELKSINRRKQAKEQKKKAIGFSIIVRPSLNQMGNQYLIRFYIVLAQKEEKKGKQIQSHSLTMLCDAILSYIFSEQW